MIRAIYRRGKIQPIDHIPAQWQEGDELVVEQADVPPTAEEIEAWAAEVEEAASQITPEEHDAFTKALAEVEAESKEMGRREMERLE